MPAGFVAGKVDVWTPLRPSTRGEGGGSNYQMLARIRPGVSWSQADAEVAQLGSEAAKGQSLVRRHRRLFTAATAAGGDDRRASAAADAVGSGRSRAAHRLREHRGPAARAVEHAHARDRDAHGARQWPRGGDSPTARRECRAGAGRRAAWHWPRLDHSRCRPDAGGRRADVRVPRHARRVVSSSRRSWARWERASSSAWFPRCTRVASTCRRPLPNPATRGVAGRSSRWARRLLVVGEVAMGVVLLVSAGLLVRTFVHLNSLEPGLRSLERRDGHRVAAGRAVRRGGEGRAFVHGHARAHPCDSRCPVGGRDPRPAVHAPAQSWLPAARRRLERREARRPRTSPTSRPAIFKRCGCRCAPGAI